MADLTKLDRMFVQQKAKLIELNNEYKIFDESGAQVGVCREEGQTKLKKALRLVSNLDSMMTHKLSLHDSEGNKVLEFTRPRTLWKSKVEVQDATGQPVGSIAQKNMLGKIRFDLTGSAGEPLGQIRAENWRAWNFSIVDASDKEVARITKKWAGAAKELFTTADNYMVEIDPDVPGSLRMLILASAAGIDTALKQSDK
ncbi:MAG: phospholipid scramblase family protein [Actinomycetota bacterium]|nr:phospholipid scramblase family protein [Actinomycetota bacterium]